MNAGRDAHYAAPDTTRLRGRMTHLVAAVASTLLVLGLLGHLACRKQAEPASPPSSVEGPHIIVVLSDALRAASLPLHGYPRDNAPHLVGLSRQGIVFMHHLSNAAGTPSSVSQLFTGRLAPPLLLGTGFSNAAVRELTDDLLILPKVLQEIGYETAIVTSHPWFDATARVLDFFEYQALVRPRGRTPYAPMEDLLPHVRRFLDERATAKPFFLYVHSMDTHEPYEFHDGFEPFRSQHGWPEAYNRYDSEILYTDHGVGQIVELLKERGHWDQSLFVFTSDHGEELGEQGDEWWNFGHGATLRRIQVHVPLVICLPGGELASTRWLGLTRHIDVAPTLLRLARPGFPLPRYRLDGKNLSTHLRNGNRGGGPTRSLAWSARHWALYTAEREVVYDQWKDAFAAYTTERDERNYPKPVKLAEGDAAGLKEELAKEYKLRTREFLGLPPTQALLGRAYIGIPTIVVHGESDIPTYRRDPLDHRWFLRPTNWLEAGPLEQPGPLMLAVPWARGTYRILVRLRYAGGRELRNRFWVQLGSNPPMLVDSEEADEAGRVDIGLQTIGNLLTVRITEPSGGVAIDGFQLELEGSAAELLEPEEDLKERLRALGYVH